MSSGTRSDPNAARKVTGAVASKVMARIERLGMSQRQQTLNQLYSYYRCVQYDARRCDWDGKERVDPIAHEAIATVGYLPGGFYDAGQQDNPLPLKFRRPTSPYHLQKVVVDRFTGLLFSERRHPVVRVQNDPDTEDYVNALAEAARLWPTMIRARTLGGAMGTVALGFKFVDGCPEVEVHDARWLTPTFSEQGSLKLLEVEQRYQFYKEERDLTTGRWETVWYWSRRVINTTTDVVYEPVPVGDGEEPVWKVRDAVEHGLGFCPVVWVQNIPVMDDMDGDPDCHGIVDTCETIDQLLAQSVRGLIANCDPTLVLVTEARLDQIKKGSGNAIKLPPGSTADYLELQGVAAKAAMDAVDKLRAEALEVAQCVLEHPDVANRTATEIERMYDSMYAKADIFREQYGQRGVLPLLTMMARAASKMITPRIERDEQTGQRKVVRDKIYLPPKVDADGTETERKLGNVENLRNMTLQWPRYVEPTHQDALLASQAAVTASAAKLIDREHAASYVATYFDVEDVPGMLEKIEEKEQSDKEQFQDMAFGGKPGGGFGQGAEDDKDEQDKAAG